MATFKVIKNNLNAYADMAIVAFRHIRSVPPQEFGTPGWLIELEWDTNRPELLEELLTNNDAIERFERIA